MGLWGSSVFGGWMIGSIFIPRLGDLYGRKKPFMTSLLIALIAHICLCIPKNLYLTAVLFFIFGTCCSGRYAIAFVYLSELIPIKYRNIVGGFT